MTESKPNGRTGIDQLVMIANPTSPAAEAYRTLRATIQLGRADGLTAKVLFTSSESEDGKSTTIANLGVAAAQAGSRVILVDGDLRRPRLHEIFGLPNGEGLATLLARGVIDDVPTQETTIKGLRVLTSGPAPTSPVDLLSGAAMRKLVTSLAEDADLLMLDSPPAGTLADASVLAGCVDGVVLVLDARRTRREHAQRAKTQLERVHANILGVVLGNGRVDTSAYRY